MKGWAALNRAANPEGGANVAITRCLGPTRRTDRSARCYNMAGTVDGNRCGQSYGLPARGVVIWRPRTVWAYSDQRAVGVRDAQACLLIRKRAEIWGLRATR